MATKSDNAAHVGMHVFERAGLGRAPFRVVGYYESCITHPDGTTQASGNCIYCGTGIRWCCVIQSSDGNSFVVGSDCVNKTGDAGLIKAYKSSPEYRKAQSDRRWAKGQRDRATFFAFMNEHADALRKILSCYSWKRERGETLFDDFAWELNHSGAAGCARLVKSIPNILKNVLAA